ncbi:MAG: hypothetical protein QG597_2670 [Actinomycetota bacterium]|nr:hypothetical protein [Actinomycetota bacterium]
MRDIVKLYRYPTSHNSAQRLTVTRHPRRTANG